MACIQTRIGKRKAFISFVDTDTVVEQPCPAKLYGGVMHTPAPHGFLDWHAWADKMRKTHRQRRCEHCGLFAIWEPKPPRKPKVIK